MLDELLERSEGPALLLVLDGVTDPHNLGACPHRRRRWLQAVIVPMTSRPPSMPPCAGGLRAPPR